MVIFKLVCILQIKMKLKSHNANIRSAIFYYPYQSN